MSKSGLNQMFIYMSLFRQGKLVKLSRIWDSGTTEKHCRNEWLIAACIVVYLTGFWHITVPHFFIRIPAFVEDGDITLPQKSEPPGLINSLAYSRRT
jgi:hypothetical protein